jgi:hypothetical protein
MEMRFASNLVVKAGAAAILVALGDWLFWERGFGSNLGWFAFAWTAVTLLMTPELWRDRASLIAAAAALLFAAILSDSPGMLPAWLFLAALAMAALLRFARFDNAAAWALRLMLQGMVSIIGPWRDLFAARSHIGSGDRLLRLVSLLALPLIGSLVFLLLFAAANPVISDALSRFALPNLDFKTIARIVFWAVLFTTAWATLRPHWIQSEYLPQIEWNAPAAPVVSTASVLLALAIFNALFAWQNALDIAFLWSGAALPHGVTLADYAHRGAYPLIVTALLAGLFVLIVLRPGSATAAVPMIRALVVLWIVQNVFLVASSALRTIDYVEAYSLTILRIAALEWMALVAIGLVLILWRMLQGYSAAWLINTNAVAVVLLLTGSSMVDLGAIAAAWNIRHAREAGGKGAALDLCYLREIGQSSLVSLVTLERRPGLTPELADRIAWVRHQVLADTLRKQASGGWTWRNARRLAAIQAMLAGTKLAAPPPRGRYGRGCDGALLPPPEAAAPNPYTAAPPGAALTNPRGE